MAADPRCPTAVRGVCLRTSGAEPGDHGRMAYWAVTPFPSTTTPPWLTV